MPASWGASLLAASLCFTSGPRLNQFDIQCLTGNIWNAVTTFTEAKAAWVGLRYYPTTSGLAPTTQRKFVIYTSNRISSNMVLYSVCAGFRNSGVVTNLAVNKSDFLWKNRWSEALSTFLYRCSDGTGECLLLSLDVGVIRDKLESGYNIKRRTSSDVCYLQPEVKEKADGADNLHWVSLADFHKQPWPLRNGESLFGYVGLFNSSISAPLRSPGRAGCCGEGEYNERYAKDSHQESVVSPQSLFFGSISGLSRNTQVVLCGALGTLTGIGVNVGFWCLGAGRRGGWWWLLSGVLCWCAAVVTILRISS